MAKHQDNCEICRKIGEAREGRHAGLIAELDTGYAVLGDSQFFEGYSLLLRYKGPWPFGYPPSSAIMLKRLGLGNYWR